MNKARLLTISKKNLAEIDAATKAADYLLSKTQRFPSTIKVHESVVGYLRVLRSSYAVRLGPLEKGEKFPYKVLEFQKIKGLTNLLATFAAEKGMNENAKPFQARAKILEVFDLAIARVEWLEAP